MVALRTHLEGGDESIIFRKLLLQDSAQGMGNCKHTQANRDKPTRSTHRLTDSHTATQQTDAAKLSVS